MRLLKCIAQAVAKNGARLLVDFLPGGQVLFDIAIDAWQRFHEGAPVENLRDEVQALAQTTPEQARVLAQEAAQAVAGDQQLADQLQLVAYLSQVPAMIRRSLKRPSDP